MPRTPQRADSADGWLLQQLGDCLGKGAFGSVYRALNWNTGETVAVKQVKLVDLPKSELRVIMVNPACVVWPNNVTDLAAAGN